LLKKTAEFLELWLTGSTSPQLSREKASVDDSFRDRLIDFITTIACECLPTTGTENEDENGPPELQVFQPFPDPESVDFDNIAATQVNGIVRSRQMHSRHHTATCFKYNTSQCRLRFPRELVPYSFMDPETRVIRIKRDDPWLNGYNPWLSLALRANHDVQYLHTQDHGLAIMYYILKYISKSEQSLYSKLAIAAAVRTAQTISHPTTVQTGKQVLQQIYNKIQSHREVGIPEAISHLLEFPDHYTDETFTSINTTDLHRHIDTLNRQWNLHVSLGQMIDENADDDMLDGEIVMEHHTYQFVTFFDDYQYRGDTLKSFCLYDYTSLYYKSKFHGGLPFQFEHPQHRTYSQFRRTDRPSIPNLLGCLTYLNSESKDLAEKEKFFCILTALFIPWTKDTVQKVYSITWEEYFNSHSETLSGRLRRHIDNIRLLRKSKEESQLDRLQKAAVTCLPLFMIDNESEPADNDSMQQVYDSSNSLLSEGELIAQALALRDAQNATDFYTLEAVDACVDFGYISTDNDISQSTSEFQNHSRYLLMHSRSIKTAMKELGERSAPSHSHSEIINRDIRPTVSIAADDLQSSIRTIAQRLSLNRNQGIALEILAKHASDASAMDGSNQLLMGVFSEAGTGKSTVIEAMREWFKGQRREEELIITATTGAAASHISAVTLHSATGISIEECDVPKSPRNTIKRSAEWANRRYLVVDEVSMLDRATMEKLDKQLKRITGNSNVYFGGMNMLFFGDFLQFPTVSHMDLYQSHPKNHSFGHELWRSLTTTIILEEQMRQSDDPIYGDLLHRVRLRQPSDDDIILLNSRIGAPLPTSCISPVVTRRHTVRRAINNVRLTQASQQAATPITYCIADVFKAKKTHQKEIYNISYGDGRGTSKAKSDAILALVPGAPLMITANINVPLGTVTSFD
jgi:hypothetical protein